MAVRDASGVNVSDDTIASPAREPEPEPHLTQTPQQPTVANSAAICRPRPVAVFKTGIGAASSLVRPRPAAAVSASRTYQGARQSPASTDTCALRPPPTAGAPKPKLKLKLPVETTSNQPRQRLSSDIDSPHSQHSGWFPLPSAFDNDTPNPASRGARLPAVQRRKGAQPPAVAPAEADCGRPAPVADVGRLSP